MKKVIANKKPNNQVFYKFKSINDFVNNIEEVQWNGVCKFELDTAKNILRVKSYEGWTEFDPATHYLSNSDVGCYYPVSTEYFKENYEIGEK